jgi:hypothetical protein
MKHKRKHTVSPRICIVIGLYLLFSVGVVKSTHFCMGREASVAFFTADAPKCGCTSFNEEGADCCDNQQELLKVDDSQKDFSALQLPDPGLALIGFIYADGLYPRCSLARTASSPVCNHPLGGRALYQLHCSLVFYDRKSIT